MVHTHFRSHFSNKLHMLCKFFFITDLSQHNDAVGAAFPNVFWPPPTRALLSILGLCLHLVPSFIGHITQVYMKCIIHKYHPLNADNLKGDLMLELGQTKRRVITLQSS